MDNWSFNDSMIWESNYPACGGNKQSPINISPETAINCNLLCKTSFINKPSDCGVAFQNGMVKVNCSNSSLNYNGVVYTLKNNGALDRPAVSIHIPSLHTIDNRRFDVEILMTYSSFSEGNANSKDNGIIVSRLLNRFGGDYGSCNDWLNQLINQIPIESLKSYLPVKVSSNWGAAMLIPPKKTFFTYEGSMPYPLRGLGCLENYRCVVFTHVDNIGETNYNILKSNIGSDSRIVQPLNSRTVFFNNGEKDPILNELENPPFSTDKFLKCKRRSMTKKKQPKTIIVNEIDETGISSNTLNNIRNILLLIILILMLVLAYYFIKLAYKRFWIQKLLRKLAGSEKISNNVWNAWKDTRKIYTKKIEKLKDSSEVV